MPPRCGFPVPVYEYFCKHCGSSVDRLLPHDQVAVPGPCPDCGQSALRRRFSRVAVRLEGWGFPTTDAMVPERPGRGDFRTVRDRADRIREGHP